MLLIGVRIGLPPRLGRCTKLGHDRLDERGRRFVVLIFNWANGDCLDRRGLPDMTGICGLQTGSDRARLAALLACGEGLRLDNRHRRDHNIDAGKATRAHFGDVGIPANAPAARPEAKGI